jgi:HTH-type transcriptional regulator, sugar sensing transcriptional regulator
MLDNALQKIGLSEKEAKVYLAALELGQSPVQKIAAKAKVNRATTYVILEGLMKKGVITTFEQGKKRFFVAEAPQALRNIIGQQQEELNKKEDMLAGLMPQLQSVHNMLPNKPVVRFYEGKEGLKAMLQEYWDLKPKEALLFYAPHALQGVFTAEEIQQHRKNRIDSGIHIRGVYADTTAGEALKNIPNAEYRCVPNEKFPFSSDVTVYSDRVAIASLHGHISGVIIESKAIADTFRCIFQLAYEAAERYQPKPVVAAVQQ